MTALRPCPEHSTPSLWAECQFDLPPEVWPEDCASWFRWKAEVRGWTTTEWFGTFQRADGVALAHPRPTEIRRQMDVTALWLRRGLQVESMGFVELLHFAEEVHLYRALEVPLFRKLSASPYSGDMTMGLFPLVIAAWGKRVADLTVREWADRRLKLLAELRRPA